MKENESILMMIEKSIKTVPNYPKEGILFRDITSLLENANAFSATIQLLTERFKNKGIEKVVGTEARGFIFGAPLAIALNVGFVLVRKPGKLPRKTIREEYELEYGTDCLEIHADALEKHEKVLIVDDLLATGGTVSATAKLVRRAGGIVEDAAFIIELLELEGRKKLDQLGIKAYSLIQY